MKRLLTHFGLLLALSAAVPASHHPKPVGITAHTSAAVYVCMSKGSVAYHSSDHCAGLNRCSHEVKAMTADDAAQLGKRACLKCY